MHNYLSILSGGFSNRITGDIKW